MCIVKKKDTQKFLNFSVCVFFRNFRRLYFNDFSRDLVVFVRSFVRTYEQYVDEANRQRGSAAKSVPRCVEVRLIIRLN